MKKVPTNADEYQRYDPNTPRNCDSEIVGAGLEN
jgi:hypothetical protein